MDDKRLDLNLLLALEALLAERNVTRAAQRLNLSQPALSAQLARLRILFGDELLTPTSRGVVPTATGAELEVPLRRALGQVRDVVAAARGFDPMVSSVTLTVAASDYMQVSILLPFLIEMSAVAPGVRLMVNLMHDSRAVHAALEKGVVDVAFLQREDVAGTSLRRMDVLSERYIGVARKGRFDDGAITLDTFTEARHIMVSPRGDGFAGATDIGLAAVGRSRHVAFAVSSFLVMLETVAASDLIALAPERLARRYIERLDLFTPPVEVAGFCIAMVWHERTDSHPAREWLRGKLAEFCLAH
ncbi:LysR family transcriptional regulator [Luteibacter aegosomatissinici]|uniref:LysR family transcriptional regulator n=1 Tax=Luteibacter aegosomatissinici TaxID=2911539 RepID=UPI001FF916B4|nr:LysR family transcriptional regulator [Luteibacter aegosomatissinici]UPG92722.1 LysR family transcriptional regulator [Luteibacter aegosomatissinici]